MSTIAINIQELDTSVFFRNFQGDIERVQIEEAVKILKNLITIIKSDISQLTVSHLLRICDYFDTIINSIDDKEKLDIADQIIKF